MDCSRFRITGASSSVCEKKYWSFELSDDQSGQNMIVESINHVVFTAKEEKNEGIVDYSKKKRAAPELSSGHSQAWK